MTKACSSSSLALALVFCFLLMSRAELGASTVTCNPMALIPCAPAINSSASPTSECCSKLREQQPCFCRYAKDQTLQKYINSDKSKKVAIACKVPFPKC